MSGGADLAPVLEYLRALGWEEVYRPVGAAVAGAPRGAGTSLDPTDPGRVAPTVAHPEAVHAAARAVPPPVTGVGSGSGAGAAGGPGGVPADLPAVAVAAAANPPEAAADRAALLARVGAEALACARCGLAAGRRSVVFAAGNPDADLMFVGEGPGAEEDRQGLPFVGPAGQLLTRIIQAMGYAREDVYIANVVKCRPPGNRDPRPDEVAACRAFLAAQIRLVRPRVIVALGRVAGQTLLGADLPVARLRGRWHELLGVPLRVTYHPAAILRDASLKRPTWDDMQVVRDRLATA